MNPALAWTLAGIALCGAEALHPGVFLLWIGLAAVGAGAATWASGLAFAAQASAFLALLAVLLCIPLLRRRLRPSPGAGVNAPEAGLIGQSCRALAFDGPLGRVSFRDGTWPARMADGSAPATGATLRVVGLEGTTLLVG